MRKNEGQFDRMSRVGLGIAVLSLAFWGPQTTLAYLGLIPLTTGLIGVCPLYTVFGFSTCKKPDA
jgi:hypothetical protein